MDNRILENSMAENGLEYISDTETHTATQGIYVGLMVTADVTISAITPESNITGNTLVGAIIPAGNWPIRFYSIRFTSGTGFAVMGV